MTSDTVFLHIGSPKCASSSVQQFIFGRGAKGIAVAGFRVCDSHLTFEGIPNSPLWFLNEIMDDPYADRVVAEKIKQAPATPLLITSENLASPMAARLFARVNRPLSVLHFARRQDEWLLAAWKEWFSKAGISLADYIDQALARHEPDFLGTAKAWSAIAEVQTEFIEFIPTSVEATVAAWLGIEDVPQENGHSVANASFDYRLVDILSRHHAIFRAGAHDRKIDGVLGLTPLAYANSFRLPDDISQTIRECFRADNVAMLGEEREADLFKTKNRLITSEHESHLEQHDFAIACLLQIAAELSERLEALSNGRTR